MAGERQFFLGREDPRRDADSPRRSVDNDQLELPQLGGDRDKCLGSASSRLSKGDDQSVALKWRRSRTGPHADTPLGRRRESRGVVPVHARHDSTAILPSATFTTPVPTAGTRSPRHQSSPTRRRRGRVSAASPTRLMRGRRVLARRADSRVGSLSRTGHDHSRRGPQGQSSPGHVYDRHRRRPAGSPKGSPNSRVLRALSRTQSILQN